MDDLFILRGIINHAKYLGKRVWLTFYDIEKCFDSLWAEDCIDYLWDLGVKDDILRLIYFMNIKATVPLKTPQTHGFFQTLSSKEQFFGLYSTTAL